MPFCNIYRVRRSLFGKSILQQYFDATALQPKIQSGWRDVSFNNAPAMLQKVTLVSPETANLLNLQQQINISGGEDGNT